MKKLTATFNRMFFLQLVPAYVGAVLLEIVIRVLNQSKSETIYLELGFFATIFILARQFGFLVNVNTKRQDYPKLYLGYAIGLGVINTIISLIVSTITPYKLLFLQQYILLNSWSSYLFIFLLTIALTLVIALLIMLYQARSGMIFLTVIATIIVHPMLLPEIVKSAGLVVADVIVTGLIMLLISMINNYSRQVDLKS
ncbi:hypothetical protein R4Y45_07120 [Holzapfeliella sp. He02]|uniref:Uncharacterized protein n=1 Tax=Holzapfeliella saturejae TaxID=3082953 RepID=A0ABU8SID8_9LACO